MRAHRLEALVGEAEHDEPAVVILARESIELRHHRATRTAPSRPKIQHHDATAERVEAHRVRTRDELGADLGRRRADQRPGRRRGLGRHRGEGRVQRAEAAAAAELKAHRAPRDPRRDERRELGVRARRRPLDARERVTGLESCERSGRAGHDLDDGETRGARLRREAEKRARAASVGRGVRDDADGARGGEREQHEERGRDDERRERAAGAHPAQRSSAMGWRAAAGRFRRARCTTTVVRRSTALGLALLGLVSLGFEWEGRLARLTRDLDSGEASRRRDVVRLLAAYPASDVRAPLLRALEDADAGVRIEAADVAARVHLVDAAPLLVGWLDDPDVALREASAAALGRLGDAPHLAQLVRALGDADARVRRAAVGALAALGGREVVVPLLGRLDDDDPQVRADAATALAALRDDRAAVPLVGRARDPVPEVRAAVYAALGDLGDARGLAPLAQGLRDDNDDARLAAIGALGRLGDDAAVDPLADRLDTEPARPKRAIVAALGALTSASVGGTRALEALVAALSDPDTASVAADVLVLRAETRTAIGASAEGPGATAPAWDARPAIVAALASGLDRGLSPAPVARALARLAMSGRIDGAAAALERAVDARIGADGSLLRALALTGTEAVLVRLLEELRATDVPHQTWALEALSAYFDRAEPDGRAADPLLAALGRVPPTLRREVVRLLGRVKAQRALPALRPLLASPDGALRLATVQAIGEIGGGGAALLPLLDDLDAGVRFEAADALARTGDATTAAALAARLDGRAPADRHALALALGGVLGSLRLAAAPAAARVAGLAALLRAARGEDLALAARALDALAVAADPDVVPALVVLAESTAPSRRAAAVRALGAFDDPRALATLRAAAVSPEPDVALAALGVLGEHGTADDVPLLLEAATHARWPRSAGAAFALSRLARRGALADVPDAPAKLCALFSSRDVYVRANAASALAALGAGTCAPPALGPLELLRPQHGEVVRLAAARWAAAAARAGSLPRPETERALARCVANDTSVDVARACAASEEPSLSEVADVVAYDASGRTLRAGALLALRLSDGSVLVARSDANAHVRLENAPRGSLSLDDPLDTPLDPH